nr:MBL fold metallo-hydrolase [Haliscomenobacter sp.]
MANVLQLTFNPFQENTYLVYDDTKECLVLDPGCLFPDEKAELQEAINHLGLHPVRLINTHCHIDHILGNRFIAD